LNDAMRMVRSVMAFVHEATVVVEPFVPWFNQEQKAWQ